MEIAVDKNYTGEYEFEPDENDGSCYVARLTAACEVLIFPTEYEGAKISCVYSDGDTPEGKDTVREVIVPEGIMSLSGPLFECFSSLERITLSATVLDIGEEAIIMCPRLSEISVSRDNPAYRSVGGSLYTRDGKCLVRVADATVCESFTLPDSVREIAANAFYGCDRVKSITLSEGLARIGNNAFAGCKSLREIKLPRTLIGIGGLAFARCTALTEILIPEFVCEMGYNVFSGNGTGLRILCEASEASPFWDEDWNADGFPGVWGC